MSSARSAVRTSPAPRAGSPGNRRWHAGDVVTAERDDDNENADLSKRYNCNPMDSWTSLNQQIVACTACPRLRQWCEEVGLEKRKSFADWEYWTKPIPNFGDPQARLLIVGLAPAAHGANRTGRMFTGDRSGDWLFRALHKAGFANQPTATSADDGLQLKDCAIAATCHCAPPDNKPTRDEIAACRDFLTQTIDLVPARVYLALGQIAWKSLCSQLRERGWLTGKQPKFGHGASVPLADDRWLLGSFHPSQQNTFTGKLTEAMFDEIFAKAKSML
jgi:uracil-DNA glycosylase family 4